MTNTKEIRDRFLLESRNRLESLGFQRRTKKALASNYKLKISDDCEAIVLLVLSSDKQGPYCTYTIGSRLLKAEAIVDFVAKSIPSARVYRDEFMCTLGTNLGYLCPQADYLTLRASIPSEIPPLVEQAVGQIMSFGMKFVKENSTLQQVAQFKSRGGVFRPSAPIDPIIFALVGDFETALMLVERDFLQTTHFEREQIVVLGERLIAVINEIRRIGPEAFFV